MNIKKCLFCEAPITEFKRFSVSFNIIGHILGCDHISKKE